jgi:acyl-coenzyme A thioesterase PaaI-like protein
VRWSAKQFSTSRNSFELLGYLGEASEMTSPWDDLKLQDAKRADSFVGLIDERWTVVALPIGGFSLALAIEAMVRVLNDEAQELRTVTAMFAAPVRSGPVEIDVTVLRRGRSVSQLTATLRNPGNEAGLTAVAAFGANRRGFTFNDLTMPAVRPADQCQSWDQAKPADFVIEGPPPPYWTQVVESRLAVGRWDWEPPIGGMAEDVNWFRFHNAPTAPDGFLHRAVTTVLADSMPGAMSSKIADDNWFSPSVDLTIHYTGQLTPGWILAHGKVSWAGDGYASASVDLWDPRTNTLAARATQVMLFTFSS